MSKEYLFALKKIYHHMDLDKFYQLVREHVKQTRIIELDVRESLNHVLAENIYSPYDRPLFDLSHADGFAVKYDDIRNASEDNPVKLRIVRNINSRKANDYTLKNGEAIFVETGYPLPIGADTVIPIEDTIVENEYVYIRKPLPRFSHVFPRGSDYSRGEQVFSKGTRITPFILKTLLDLGVGEIRVYDKPRVALFSVGDELVDEPFDPINWRLPTSTRFLEKYAIEYYGGLIIREDKLPDDPKSIVEAVSSVVGEADIIVTIGGVSMGPRDHTWISLYEAFKPQHYWRGLKMHPARSTSGLFIDGKSIINQPGLHQSSLSALILVITPVLNYVQGQILEPRYPCINLSLMNKYVENKYIDHYRVRPVKIHGSKCEIIDLKGSYYLSPINMSDGFTVLKPGTREINVGDNIRVCFYEPIHKIYNISAI
ncbi:MoeA domain protein, domain I and II [Staphylothermus marinus F1]|uniref:MoeA domain protein, domain I and II n=1 Tax=Staphylothermus marinus (strain ATCC 43588 / DSM 3639 / JCM 9404 / F1) TaxID=399550 RepID=A3DPW8_STAMF|nr:molybdopterin molybdotransferase MoeA [Staphylothermus marinus]ABN70678.1 MoeA domain protein, domain I and II [Staphylothermus marinus F1]